MPDTDSITMVKRSTYRGALEEWSNTYHFEGTTPTTDAGWKGLADAIWAVERQLYNGDTKLVRAYGYEAGNETSVAQIDYVAAGGTLPAGSGSFTNDTRLAGDQAVMLRAYVGQSVKGKKVYVRKYFHFTQRHSTDPDLLNPTIGTVLGLLGTKLTDGTLPGGVKWCGPQGADASNPTAGPFVTTRTLKRRGKRPTQAG